MNDWERHIRKDGNAAYCGASIFMEWHFMDLDHATRTVEQGGRLAPCPKCLATATPGAVHE
jgi:hypothetical protein